MPCRKLHRHLSDAAFAPVLNIQFFFALLRPPQLYNDRINGRQPPLTHLRKRTLEGPPLTSIPSKSTRRTGCSPFFRPARRDSATAVVRVAWLVRRWMSPSSSWRTRSPEEAVLLQLLVLPGTGQTLCW